MRVSVAGPVVAAAVLLGACGGERAVDDISSPIAQECKAELLAIAREGGKRMAELSRENAPAACLKVTAKTGGEIARQIEAETRAGLESG